MAYETTTIPVETLRSFTADIFAAAGCDRPEAEQIAHYLLSANLTGHDSHGVIRTPRYILWLQEGKVRAGQTLTVVHETATQATLDGNYGFGQTIGPLAVDVGIAKAQQAGMAAIGLRNAGHVGRIGDWAERAAAAGLISIHFVNVQAGELVAPFGGVDRRFSTNPICIGVPTDKGPIILDFATSLVAEGKVLVASNGGKPVPPGALIEPSGKLSSDPRTLYGPIDGTRVRDSANGEGALRTFGEHKGSGLAFMCELLAGCLTGGGTSGPIPGGKRGRIANGMLSIYLSPGSFGTARFSDAVHDYARYVKASRPAESGVEVLIPGEPEIRKRQERLRNGIPLQAETWAAICDTARSLGLSPPAAAVPNT
ncbi:malate/lactate/ureidoglycolate dehydrogenase [Rhodopila globiformis]|uniref:Malate/lactate/ureidoglycolate dehydrogenase n=1 Tax=Rhodopila globiformis TaxID=1071 RepID=A0A2S6NIQ4_RHOGL|nr:malate/lactate/ureidoglycolate dehydrogenase [Rhodopila globiformis]PPQ34498.1 malate/lactate/ureidoglycolate dehydrogenase [Rhodopila globiformis]